MGEKRQPFRFRLPWLSTSATIRPVVASHPAAQTEAPSQPSTTIPIQRPPFRPAGIATTPTQAQASARKTEPQPAATSRPASPPRHQVRASSVPPSPSRRVTETQGTSRPVSASRARIRTQGGSQTRSPSRAPTQARAVSTSPAPSRIVSQPQSTAQAVSKQQSLSPLASQPAGQTSPQTSSSRRATQAQTSLPSNKSPTIQERSHPSSSTRPPSPTSTQTQPYGDVVKRDQQMQEGTGTKKTSATSSTQNKAHQKHASSNWEQVPLHNEIKEDISKFVHRLTTEQSKLVTEEKPISVLTLAGENRGASFQVGSESSKEDGSVHIRRGYKINPDDSPDATTDGEESSRGRKPTDSATKENPASRTYVNNNAQSVNNSVVFESSVNARNPGVYVELSHNVIESTKSNSTKAENVQPQKAGFNITPTEKLTYKPTVRRRCLRGLFAESSDSDPDNPDKPRRHGCRYSCGGKNKQEETEIF